MLFFKHFFILLYYYINVFFKNLFLFINISKKYKIFIIKQKKKDLIQVNIINYFQADYFFLYIKINSVGFKSIIKNCNYLYKINWCK